jgi:hypothetical protein
MNKIDKYLINEGKLSSVIEKEISNWEKDISKLNKKFELKIAKIVNKTDDVEELENIRDQIALKSSMEYIDPSMAENIGDLVDDRIEQLYKEIKV